MSETSARPVIAVDAMGGDHGPETVVPGALANLTTDSPYAIAFYGRKDAVAAVLAEHTATDLPVTVVPCTQDIAMGESPASAIRNRPDSPIVKAMTDQKAGKVQAVISAGSTGAMVAASLIVLGRLPGVDRPAIATVIPTARQDILLLDAGANVQCKPEHLVSFARMGVVFAREMFGRPAPTVGQLNIGGEPGKGNELTTAAYALLAESGLDFHGNVEGNEFMLGPCDVVVADGFTGNNTLKLVEGFARFLAELAGRDDLSDAERAGFRPVLGFLQRKFSYEVAGGAMLLGVDGVSIISHGRSSEAAIANAVRVAWEQIHAELPARIAAAHS
ncbi:MAG: phosphate acyltransferase PlsX [bacterium]|nr:phosphate acyltransferase PlsX [bacterium]